MKDNRFKEHFIKIKLDEKKEAEIRQNLEKYVGSKEIKKQPMQKKFLVPIVIISVLLTFLLIFIIYKVVSKPKSEEKNDNTNTTTAITSVISTTTVNEYKIDSLFLKGVPNSIAKNISGNQISIILDRKSFDEILPILKKYKFQKLDRQTMDTKNNLFVLENKEINLKLNVVDDKYIVVTNNGVNEIIESPGELLTELINKLSELFEKSVKENLYDIFKANLGIITDTSVTFTNTMSKDAKKIEDAQRNTIYKYLSEKNNLLEVSSIVKTEKYIEFKKDENTLYRIYDNGLVEFSSKEFPDKNYFKLLNTDILKDFKTEKNPLEEILLNFSINALEDTESKNTLDLNAEEVSSLIKTIKESGLTKTEISEITTNSLFKYVLKNKENTVKLNIYDSKYAVFEVVNNGTKIIEAYKSDSASSINSKVENLYLEKYKQAIDKYTKEMLSKISLNQYQVDYINFKTGLNKKLKEAKKTELVNLIKNSKFANIESKNDIDPSKKLASLSSGDNRITYVLDKYIVLSYNNADYIYSIDLDSFSKIVNILNDSKNYN